MQETICTIVAADLKAGDFGIAVASSALSVGKNVPFTGAHAGAVAVQGYTSPFFGIAGMKLLRDGVPAAEVIERIMTGDPLKEHRQMIVIDVTGRPAVFSGAEITGHNGSFAGDDFAVAGCGLAGQNVIDACVKTYKSAEADIAGRMVAALAAAEAESPPGAFESAVVRVSRDAPYPFVDLRVDRHSEPVKELAHLLEVWRRKSAPSAS